MLLNNRYQVLKTLGSGGFGETFLAEDTQMPSRRCCVIKQLKPIHNNPQIYQLVQERFQREAAILEDLGGTNDQIPTLYAYFQLDSQFYLVQEWIEGDTLTSKIKNQGVFSESDVRDLLINLLPVLEYVHSKQIVHRDIKPDNIILRHRDRKPVLIDFGAVRESMGTVVNSQGNFTSSIVIGTPGYMPSEQAAGRPVYSSDLYSLGVTAIYLLTGRQAQELETDPRTGEIIWHNHAVNISPTLKTLIDQAIQYHPRDRFASAKQMLDALQGNVSPIPPTEPVRTQPPIQTTPPPPPPTVNLNTPPTVQTGGRNHILIASAIAGSLIGGSVIIALALTKSSQDSPQQPIVTQKTTSVPPLETPQTSKPEVVENQASVSPSTSSLNQTPQPQKQSTTTNLPSSFYFLADSAYPNSQTATKQVQTLKTAGYSQAGMFWIPEYPNLSGKELFEVYVDKFSDRNSCINFLKTYGRDNSQAYCAFASQDANASTNRLYFKEISTSSTPSVATTTIQDYSWLSQRLVTDSDLDTKDGFELDIMRNSIFARYGRRFNTPGLQKYFDNQPWYRPTYSPKNFPSNLLSGIEQQNVEYISKYQDYNNRRYFKK